MSRYLQHNEITYELHDNEQQRRHRRAMLRVVYAMANPGGWDARRLDMHPRTLRDAFHTLKEEFTRLKEAHARQQAAHHPGAGLAGESTLAWRRDVVLQEGPQPAVDDRIGNGRLREIERATA